MSGKSKKVGGMKRPKEKPDEKLSVKKVANSPPIRKPENVLKILNNRMLGRKSSPQLISAPIINHLQQLTPYNSISPFTRRATCMAWHPTHMTTLAVGSKGGDLILWNYEKPSTSMTFLEGVGKGGQILAMKFHPESPSLIYRAGVDGRVSLTDFYGKYCKVFLDVMDPNKWFCSFDVSSDGKTLVAGDTDGNVTLMSNEGEKIWNLKLHSSKVTHAEFNVHESWVLATTSNDRTLKIWDIRNLKDKNSVLHSHQHNRAVVSGYFSSHNGTRLLTTDQQNEIRIYTGPLWTLERSILHPHRHFQHLTSIKASWHPLMDIISVGRYPDKSFEGYIPGERRTIDFFDADTGKMLYQLDTGHTGIISLNEFNKTGEVLGSCMGYNVLILKNKNTFTKDVKAKPENKPRVRSKSVTLKKYEVIVELRKLTYINHM